MTCDAPVSPRGLLASPGPGTFRVYVGVNRKTDRDMRATESTHGSGFIMGLGFSVVREPRISWILSLQTVKSCQRCFSAIARNTLESSIAFHCRNHERGAHFVHNPLKYRVSGELSS